MKTMNNEAFERAKSAYGTGAYDDATMEFIFPQLAESEDESYDERIRKCIGLALTDVEEQRFMDYDTSLKECLSWLKKQKEQKTPMSNDLDEEIERFFDECIEAHDAKIYGVNKQVITVDCYELTARHFAKWGEKLKEQKSVIVTKQEYDSHSIVTGDAVSVKPAEWSEEEKDKMNSIERLIVNANAHGNGLIGDKEAIELQHFIRSIVKPITNIAELSEEDEKMWKKTQKHLEDYIREFDPYHSKQGRDVGACLSWLKSIRPVSKESLQSWKPSKEQMKALNAINCHGDLSYVGQQSQLISLYNDLKKLM